MEFILIVLKNRWFVYKKCENQQHLFFLHFPRDQALHFGQDAQTLHRFVNLVANFEHDYFRFKLKRWIYCNCVLWKKIKKVQVFSEQPLMWSFVKLQLRMARFELNKNSTILVQCKKHQNIFFIQKLRKDPYSTVFNTQMVREW